MQNNYVIKDKILKQFDQQINLLEKTKKSSEDIEIIAEKFFKCIKNGGTIFWCGNGGSASDSQHLAAELVGRFKLDRDPINSIALTTDTSIITSIANDYSYKEIFSRQLKAIGKKGDILVVISTSGNSDNILKVLEQSNLLKINSVGFLGKDGGKAKELVDHKIIIPSFETARIQECHIFIGHLLIDLLENHLNTLESK